MNVRLPYVHEFRDRHGKPRYYFRRKGWQQFPLPGQPGSPEFLTAYNAALADVRLEAGPQSPRSAPGTVSAAIGAYYTDASWQSLAPTTRALRRQILERFRVQHGDKRIALMRTEDVARMLGRMKPWAARNWLTALKGLMQFAVAIGLRPDNPVERFKPAKAKPGSFHTWTEDEIEIFERHHALGTRARLALALLLYTAARRGDAVRLGRQAIRAGRLHYRQQKTGRTLAIPVHPNLLAAIEAAPADHLTFLVTERGAPFSANGFGVWFRKRCAEAGLPPRCTVHGLRKAAARRLAEAGCSPHEIAAITGHRSLAQVQHYTAAAEQARLAEMAFKRER